MSVKNYCDSLTVEWLDILDFLSPEDGTPALDEEFRVWLDEFVLEYINVYYGYKEIDGCGRKPL